MLDEADRMLDMGFIHDIRRIVGEAAGQAPDAVLLGDHAAGDHRARQFHAEGPGAGRGDAGRHHGRTHRPARDPGRPRRQARAARRSCCAASRSTACWSSPAPSTAPTRSCARSPQSQIAAEAIHGNKSQNQRERVLAAFRSGKVRIAGGDRHRGARHRRRRHQPRRQLRPAQHPGELRPPHRPHRARRRGRHRDLVLRWRGARLPARHREADPHLDPVDRSARRPPCGAARQRPERRCRSCAWSRRQPNGHGKKQQQAQQNKPQQSRPQQSKPAQPRKQHAAQPQQPRNGHQKQPQRNGQNHQQRNGQQHQQPRNGNQHQQHRAPAQAASDGSIASVGFMRPTQRQKHHAGGLAARRSAR